MIKKEYIITIISAVVIVFGAIYFLKNRKCQTRVLYKTEKPLVKDLIQYVNASGTLQAKDQITVGSLVAGRIEKIVADDNDVVKKDDILAILDNGIGDSSVKKVKAYLQEAKANLKYQENFFNRQSNLYKSNQISADLFEQYKSNLKVAQARAKQLEAELELAEKEYSNLFIKSPDAGIVIARKVDLGQMVTSQLQATTLYVIAKDLTQMEAKVDVDEADIGKVKEKQEAHFYVDAFPKKVFKAKVRQIQYLAKIIDNVVTYATILDVKNSDLTLRPGMTTNVNIKVSQDKNALVVHNKTLRIDSNLIKQVAKHLDYKFESLPKSKTNSKTKIDTLWIIENGLFDKKTFKQIQVKTGITQGKYTQIISGIDPDNDIITEAIELNRKSQLVEQIVGKGSFGKK